MRRQPPRVNRRRKLIQENDANRLDCRRFPDGYALDASFDAIADLADHSSGSPVLRYLNEDRTYVYCRQP